MKISNIEGIDKYEEKEDEEFPVKNKFIPFAKRGDIWSDIDPMPQFSDDVDILKINYDAATKELNDYFLAILDKNEISERAYELTKEVITLTIFVLINHRRPPQIIWHGIIDDSALIIWKRQI